MRQAQHGQHSQHGRKPRGRGRKQHNPLSRIYDSSGPDTKIRGTAAHIAEKYQSLARDATSSGHRVVAENYLQHAEHYLRILAVAQASMQPPAQPQNTHGDQPPAGERRDSRNDGCGETARADVSSDDPANAFEAENGPPRQRGEQASPQPSRNRRGHRRRQPSHRSDAPEGSAEPVSDETGKTPVEASKPEVVPELLPAAETEAPSPNSGAESAGVAPVNGAPAADEGKEKPAPRRRTRKKPKVVKEDPDPASTADAGTVDAV